MADSHICSSCGYVIDERQHPVADIGEVALLQGIVERTACPICGATEEPFRPCFCAPAPSIHPAHFVGMAKLVKVSDRVLRKALQRGTKAMKQLVSDHEAQHAAFARRQ